jgi:hypothetical protein
MPIIDVTAAPVTFRDKKSLAQALAEAIGLFRRCRGCTTD